MEQLAKQLQELAEEILNLFYDDISEKESQIEDLQQTIEDKDARIGELQNAIEDKDLELSELRMKLNCDEMEIDFEIESESEKKVEPIKDTDEEEEEEEPKEVKIKSEDLYPAFAMAEQQHKSDSNSDPLSDDPFQPSKYTPKRFPFAWIVRAQHVQYYNQLWGKFNRIRQHLHDLVEDSCYHDELKVISDLLYKKKTTKEEAIKDFAQIKELLKKLAEMSKRKNEERCYLIMKKLSALESEL